MTKEEPDFGGQVSREQENKTWNVPRKESEEVIMLEKIKNYTSTKTCTK